MEYATDYNFKREHVVIELRYGSFQTAEPQRICHELGFLLPAGYHEAYCA